MKNEKVLTLRKMTIIGVLGAISVMLGMTPLGFIPIGPTKATIMHIPVIIGSIIEGPVVGGFIGLIFGLFSIFQAITNPTPVSFVFYNPIISILPRVIMGIMPYYIYKFFEKQNKTLSKISVNIILGGIIAYLAFSLKNYLVGDINTFGIIINIVLIVAFTVLLFYINKVKKDILSLTMAATVGSLINTVGVLGGIYLIYGEQYMRILEKDINLARKFILGIAITNGIPEIILAIIITVSVVNALKKSR